MGEVTVELDPASVSGSIEARDGMPSAGRLAAVHPEITLAAECGRRGPRIDRDPLSSPAANPPQLGGRQPRSRDARRRGRRDLEVARENRIAARQPRRVEGGRILAGPAPELSKDTDGVAPVSQWPELSRRRCGGTVTGAASMRRRVLSARRAVASAAGPAS